MKKHNIQQRSDEWHHLRKGKITGSVLKSIMGTPKARQEALYEVIAQRLSIDEDSIDEYENPMERGTRLEPDAIAMFELETGLQVESIGLCEDDENSQIANSPDGLIAGCEDEAIEVKCLGGKNHIKMWLTNKIPDDYLWQVVQYFVVNDKLRKLYFVGYNPDIPSHQLHIIEVYRDQLKEEIEKAKVEQSKFLLEVENELKTKISL